MKKPSGVRFNARGELEVEIRGTLTIKRGVVKFVADPPKAKKPRKK
jgi:hypothetical protein